MTVQLQLNLQMDPNIRAELNDLRPTTKWRMILVSDRLHSAEHP